MTVVGPLDAMFLVGETREQPMHVGGLMLFELPEGAGRDHVFPEGSREYLSRLYHEILAGPVNPVFSRRVRNRPRDLGYWSWEPDEAIDLEYHVRLSALPRPGRYRELFELTSRLHGTLLDRRRPLWEMHLIEGVEGRRFAMYHKIHHSLLDGVTALWWLQQTLTPDPARTGMPATYTLPGKERPSNAVDGANPLVRTVNGLKQAGGGFVRAVEDLLGLSPVAVRALARGLQREHVPLTFEAPRTILNQPITGARRFAAQSWPIERLDKVRAITGATLNDVVLAMCSGALRNYLLGLNALPDKPLTAMVPVSLRTADEPEARGVVGGSAPGRGNSLGTLIADLATDQRDPERRIHRIIESTSQAKRTLTELSPLQNLMLGALGFGSAGPAAMIPSLAGRTPPPYNLVISNIPGPVDSPLYWNRSRLLGMYPASIVLNGQALNISVTSYDHQLHFGLTGCRRTLPHLQHLLTHLENSLRQLETL